MLRLSNSIILVLIFLIVTGHQLCAQSIVPIKENESWYGGAVNDAHRMPFKDGYSLDLYGETRGNQAVPLLVSTKGRFIWSEEPFKFSFENKNLLISKAKGLVTLDSSGKTLREAFANASKRFFSFQE